MSTSVKSRSCKHASPRKDLSRLALLDEILYNNWVRIMENLRSIRKQFPIVKSKVFMNHAAISPYPKPVLEAMRKHIEEFSEFGTISGEMDDLRRPFAKLVNGKSEEIALVANTSTGLNIVANMLNYPSGSNVVVTDLEYPSVVYPWLKKKPNVDVRYVKNVDGGILLRDVEEAVDDRTVVIAISHVEYSNGFRNDLGSLAEIAHEHGAFLLVDAIQSAGAMRVDVKRDDVDFLTAACYKWLLGPAGAGFLYVRKELVERFEPPFVGWASVKPEVFETIDLWDIWALDLSETASRFEVGSPSIISFIGAAAAIQLLLDVGMANIERRILQLTEYLIDEMEQLGLKSQTHKDQKCRSGITNFLIDRPEKRVEQLLKKGVIVSARAHGIRVSPHFYNTEEETDRFVAELSL
jgi:cysteine desulfurase/selenocysteine lyase